MNLDNSKYMEHDLEITDESELTNEASLNQCKEIANTSFTINNAIVKIAQVDPNTPPKSIYLGGCCWYESP